MHVALPDTWLRARDRLLASTRFQHWALRFPLTRYIARRRASALFDICAGFVYSQVLLACVRLKLFERLRAGPRSLSCLESELGLTRDALVTLLSAAQALGLAHDWAAKVIAATGNYGEIFQRTTGEPYHLDRGLNALWTEGGLMRPLPMK